jgi:CheY-like chemotaxis protein
MGGAIQVRSELGQGSTFSFQIVVRPVISPEPNFCTPEPSTIAGEPILLTAPSGRRYSSFRRLLNHWRVHLQEFSAPEELRQDLEANPSSAPVFLGKWLESDVSRKDFQVSIAAISRLCIQQDRSLTVLSSAGVANRELGLSDQVHYLPQPSSVRAIFDHLEWVLRCHFMDSEAEVDSFESMDPVLGARFPLNILLVEDMELNLRIVKMLVEQLGYQPQSARCGKEAIELTRTDAVDVILMDIQMPDMSGIETTRRIRELCGQTNRPSPYIVAMTASATTQRRQQCLEAGMDGFLGKPVTVPELADCLTQAFRARSHLFSK